MLLSLQAHIESMCDHLKAISVRCLSSVVMLLQPICHAVSPKSSVIITLVSGYNFDSRQVIEEQKPGIILEIMSLNIRDITGVSSQQSDI